MSYKSYAQGGQYGTYHIDIPIKEEINEDLRAAGNFAKQMERSQKYREKWANSYLSALNKKSDIERQNRDDNFEFAQNNFKRIYEGEQREFEGRLSELKREHAEEANKAAEPGFMEQLMPMLMQLAPMAINTINQMQANQQAEALKVAETTLSTLGPEASAALGRFRKEYQAAGTPVEQEQIARRFAALGLPRLDGQPYDITDIVQLLNANGDIAAAHNRIAINNGLPLIADARNAQLEEGGSLHASRFNTPDEQRRAIQTFNRNTFASVFEGIELNNDNMLAALDILSKGESQAMREQKPYHQAAAKQSELYRNVAIVSSGFANTGSLNGSYEELYRRLKQPGNPGKPTAAFIATLDNIPGIRSSHLTDLIQKRTAALPPGANPGPNINSLIVKRNEMRKSEEAWVRTNALNIKTQQNNGFNTVMDKIDSATTIGEAKGYLNEVINSGRDKAFSREQWTKMKHLASDHNALWKHINPSFNEKHKIPDNLIEGQVKAAFEPILGQGSAGAKWWDRAPLLLGEAKSLFPTYYEQVLRDNPGMSKEIAVGVAAKNLANAYQSDGRLNLTNEPGSSGYNPAKPVGTSYDNDRIEPSKVGSAALFGNRVKVATANDPQALEKIFFEQTPNSGIKLQYKSLNSVVSKIKAHPDGIMTQGDMAVLMNNPQITILADKTGHSRSQIIDWQGKALLGKDWVGLPPEFVATEQEILDAGGQAGRLMREQKMRTAESAQFIQVHKAVTEGSIPNYPLNRFVPAAAFGTSSQYNPQRVHPITGEVKGHWANDQKVPNRTPTTTLVPNGTVTDVKMDNGAAGHEYTVSYNYGGHTVEVRSLHNDEIHVQPGQVVNPGDIIGLSGSTGRSTGPHTHNEYYVDGQLVNGATFKINGKPIQEIFLGYAR